MSKVIARAPAKINLVLEVEPLRAGEDKHHLNSVFCTTTLADTLVFDFSSGTEPFHMSLTIASADLDISCIQEQDNSLTKTVEHFNRAYGFGFLPAGTLQVQLIKSIPTQAGLGGGSSDAAAMLRMLCWLAQVEPLCELSLSVARAVGADVPFFLHAPKEGFCAAMGGYGDELLAALPKPELHLALIKPARGVSTKQAYAVFDALYEAGFAAGDNTAPPVFKGDIALSSTALAPLCTNNLESAAIELLPEIGALKDEAASLTGVLGVTMCGSGSALFALCESPKAAQSCMQHFAQQGLWSVAVET